MGRPPRIQPAFATFHVTARGVRRQPIFLDRLDHVRHLEQIGTACERFGWVCLAWAHLMNHFHLVLRLVVIRAPLVRREVDLRESEGRRPEPVAHEPERPPRQGDIPGVDARVRRAHPPP